DLKYLDIVQTKDEYIESLDNWEEIADSVSIRTKLISATAGSASVEVCYHFPDNERLNVESFVFSDGLIRSSVQELKAETCDGF
ncbi:MAG: nuclear transport factor 2 family protein, partial [Nitratireductor sp.]